MKQEEAQTIADNFINRFNSILESQKNMDSVTRVGLFHIAKNLIEEVVSPLVEEPEKEGEE